MTIFGFDRKEFDDFKKRQDEITLEFRSSFNALQKAIESKITDSEVVAKTAADDALLNQQKTQALANQVETVVSEIEKAKTTADEELHAIQKYKIAIESKVSELENQLEVTNARYATFLAVQENVDSGINDITNKIQTLDSHLKISSELPTAIDEIQKNVADSKTISETIKNTLAHAVTRKGEIDELHKKIIGEDVEYQDGKFEHINGTKDELEKSFTELQSKTKNLNDVIDAQSTEVRTEYEEKFTLIGTEYDALLKSASDRYVAVNTQLTGLLPGAMAEGLSAAYEKKKIDEELSLSKYEGNFKNAIIGLVFVSLIPLAVDLYLLAFAGKDLVQVIKDTPSLIVAILPLYFPVLWLAYSSNKRLNLSKRLIEEYTHKLVLGKNFSGLSNQIETLSHQDEIKDELRTRLLFNVLQVSAENPGKLISNYNKSDHPLMEAIENSGKLSDSVERLAKIPGFSALAKKLSDKSDVLLKAQAAKVEHGLETQESIKST